MIYRDEGAAQVTMMKGIGLVVLSVLFSSSFLLVLPTVTPASVLATPNSFATISQVNYLLVIMMENHPLNISSCCGGVNGIIGNTAAPYITQLARDNGLAENYSALTTGSLSDYLSIIGGSTFSNMPCVGNESPPTTCNTTAPNLVDRIEASGKTWKAYMEDYSGGCSGTNVGMYDYWHNPFLYFTDIRNSTARCSRIVPANPGHVGLPDTQLVSDLNSTTTASNFMWLTPNQNNNMHGYNSLPPSISVGNSYLSQLIPLILKTAIFTTQNAALLVVWDEPTTCSIPQVPVTRCPVPAIWLGPTTKRNFASLTPYNHYSLPATIEALWSLSPLTPNDSSAVPMLEFFNPSYRYSISTSGDLAIVKGGIGYNTITLTQFSGPTPLNVTVSLSCVGLPASSSCLASPSSLACGNACTATLKITTTADTPVSVSQVQVVASYGSQTSSTRFSLNVLHTLQQRGDVNGDCSSNIFDLAMVSGNFGKRVSPGVNPRTDLNLDGEVNVIDLAIVASSLGIACS